MIIEDCGRVYGLHEWDDNAIERAKKTILRLHSIPNGEERIKINYIHAGWGKYDFSINDKGRIDGIISPKKIVIEKGIMFVPVEDLDGKKIIACYRGGECEGFLRADNTILRDKDSFCFSFTKHNCKRVRFDWKDIAGVLLYQDYMKRVNRESRIRTSVEIEKAKKEIVEYAKLRSRWFKAKEELKKYRSPEVVKLLSQEEISEEWIEWAECELEIERRIARSVRLSKIQNEGQTAKGSSRQLRALGLVA